MGLATGWCLHEESEFGISDLGDVSTRHRNALDRYPCRHAVIDWKLY